MKDLLLAAKIVGVLMLLWVTTAACAYWIEITPSDESLSFFIFLIFTQLFVLAIVWLVTGIVIGRNVREVKNT